MYLPLAWTSPASIVSNCVESIINGTVICLASMGNDTPHVSAVVTAGIVDVDIKYICPLAHLFMRKLDNCVPILGFKKALALSAPGCIEPLADIEK